MLSVCVTLIWTAVFSWIVYMMVVGHHTLGLVAVVLCAMSLCLWRTWR